MRSSKIAMLHRENVAVSRMDQAAEAKRRKHSGGRDFTARFEKGPQVRTLEHKFSARNFNKLEVLSESNKEIS